jgi:hypothetical protein
MALFSWEIRRLFWVPWADWEEHRHHHRHHHLGDWEEPHLKSIQEVEEGVLPALDLQVRA